MKLTLFFTHKCNLKCKYCYVDQRYNSDMTTEMGKKIIDWGIKNTNPEYFRVGFFGGEALVFFDRIQEIVKYCKEKSQKEIFHPNFVLSTNGLLLNQQIIDFLKENQFRISLSLDGDESEHNINRITHANSGSWSIVRKNLLRYLENGFAVQVITVADPSTIKSLSSSVDFLAKTGAKYILVSPNLYAKWNKKSIQVWFSEYEKIIQKYESDYSKMGISFNFIHKDLDVELKGGFAPEDTIPTGARISADAYGNIYTCDRLAATLDPQYRIGDIESISSTIIRSLDKELWRENGCYNCGIKEACGKFSRYDNSKIKDRKLSEGSLASEYNKQVDILNKKYSTKLNYLEMSKFANDLMMEDQNNLTSASLFQYKIENCLERC